MDFRASSHVQLGLNRVTEIYSILKSKTTWALRELRTCARVRWHKQSAQVDPPPSRVRDLCKKLLCENQKLVYLIEKTSVNSTCGQKWYGLAGCEPLKMYSRRYRRGSNTHILLICFTVLQFYFISCCFFLSAGRKFSFYSIYRHISSTVPSSSESLLNSVF